MWLLSLWIIGWNSLFVFWFMDHNFEIRARKLLCFRHFSQFFLENRFFNTPPSHCRIKNRILWKTCCQMTPLSHLKAPLIFHQQFVIFDVINFLRFHKKAIKTHSHSTQDSKIFSNKSRKSSNNVSNYF